MALVSSKRFTIKKALALAGLVLAGTANAGAQEASSLVGIWVGVLKVPAQSITLVFSIIEEKGALKGTIGSPDQGAMDIPLSVVSMKNGAIKLESAAIGAAFTGGFSAGGSRIDGTWAQGGAKFPLSLEKKEVVPVVLRPQEPKPPFPYSTEEAVIENAKAGVRLAGTLVIPKTAGKSFPAVVFATGSGPQNRDEELLGHKPFLVIADYLARRGIASLRFDDRGVGASTGDFSSATSLDFADDVEAAFEYLASRPEAKAGAVGILGHSEGGLLAPIVASRNARVSFVVLLAGPGLDGERLLFLQGAAIARAGGSSEAEIEGALAVNRVLYGLAKGPGEGAALAARVKEAYLGWLDSNASMKAEDRAQARRSADGAVAQLVSPWFRTFLRLDPAAYLAKLRVPLLALNGSKDLQVPPAEDLAGIRAALGAGANPKSALVELPGLNHLFQHAATGSPSEYASIEETFAPEALKAIGDWILGL